MVSSLHGTVNLILFSQVHVQRGQCRRRRIRQSTSSPDDLRAVLPVRVGVQHQPKQHVRSIQTVHEKYKSKKSITIVIIGASSSLSLAKLLTRSSAVKPADLDQIYLDLQLQFRCIIKFAENDHDLSTLILSFTKAVTVAPEKRLKNLSPFSFHVATLKQFKPIRVDIDQTNKTLEPLWKQILQQFHQMGIEQAQAIVQQYGTIQALVQAYQQCRTEDEAKLLLADIQVRRGAGVLTTTRRIGSTDVREDLEAIHLHQWK